MEVSAHDPFDVLKIVSGCRVSEFVDTETEINMVTAPDWAMKILEESKLQLAYHLGMSTFKICFHPDTIETIKRNCRQFDLKRYRYKMTGEMHAAGWRQWQSTIDILTKEQAANHGLSYRKFRYASHFWVGPPSCPDYANAIVLGKLKLDGKPRDPVEWLKRQGFQSI